MLQKKSSTIIRQQVKNNLFYLYIQNKKLLSIQKFSLYLDTLNKTIQFIQNRTKYIELITFYSILYVSCAKKYNIITITMVICLNSKRPLIDFSKKADCLSIFFLFCFL